MMQIQEEPEPIPDFTHLFVKKSAYEKVKSKLSLELAAIFEKHAENSCLEQEVEGQETSITGALRGRINDSLEAIAKSINKLKIEGVSLQSTTFRQKEEGRCGSDFVVTFEFFEKGKADPVISKSTLIQAKTAVVKDGPPKILHCSNKDLSDQLNTLESVSPGKGYLMLYTDAGAFAVPAGVANGSMKGTVLNLDFSSASKCGEIVKTMAICTGGDVDLSPKKLKAPRKFNGRVDASKFAKLITKYAGGLSYAEKVDAQSVLTISATTK
jgi:hypothetical protein